MPEVLLASRAAYRMALRDTRGAMASDICDLCGAGLAANEIARAVI